MRLSRLDTTRFQERLDSFAIGSTRRGVFAVLTGGLLAARPFAIGVDDAEAKQHTNGGGNGGKGGGNTRKGSGTVRAQKKKKLKTKTGPAGPAGADGASGAPGPAGAAGSDFTTTVVNGNTSSDLTPQTGSVASSFASCSGPGKVLSCGYEITENAAENANVLVVSVGPDAEASFCFARMQRTTSAGSIAGARIQVKAICRS